MLLHNKKYIFEILTAIIEIFRSITKFEKSTKQTKPTKHDRPYDGCDMFKQKLRRQKLNCFSLIANCK